MHVRRLVRATLQISSTGVKKWLWTQENPVIDTDKRWTDLIAAQKQQSHLGDHHPA